MVTGGAGYIGSHLVKRAIAAGYFVHVLDSVDPGESPLGALFADPNLRYFRGSLTEPKSLEPCMQDADFVVHLAGISDGRAGKENPELTRQVNSESITHLLTLARQAGVKRFIFASTMGVYGNEYAVPLSENLPLRPVDPYSESKAIGEQHVQEAATDTFCTTSLRIAMVYGVGPKVREDFLANRLCLTAVREGALTIMGGAQRRPHIHIDDLASLFLNLAGESGRATCGGIFNAVESNPSLRELADAIIGILPGTSLNVLPARDGEDSFEMSGALLRDTLGFTPATGLREGLSQIIRHYQSNKSS